MTLACGIRLHSCWVSIAPPLFCFPALTGRAMFFISCNEDGAKFREYVAVANEKVGAVYDQWLKWLPTSDIPR